MLPLQTPDITPAQLVALLTFVVGQLLAYGVISTRLDQLVLSIVAAVVPAVFAIADAIIRHGRATAAASAGAGKGAGTV